MFQKCLLNCTPRPSSTAASWRPASTSAQKSAPPSRRGALQTGTVLPDLFPSCFDPVKLNRYTGNWAGYNPYLFDYDLNPKLSYYAVVDALQSTEVEKKVEQN